MKLTLAVVLLLVLTGCTTTQTPTSSNNNQPAQPAAATQPSQPSAAVKPISELKEGEASGTIFVEGQTIALKYAYAGHGKMFEEDAVGILLTETPVAPEDVTKAFGVYGSFPRSTRGLHYNVGEGYRFWVGYNPSSFQASGTNTLKDYSVENGVVRGRDEDSTNLSGKDYKRSVSFAARIPEKK